MTPNKTKAAKANIEVVKPNWDAPPRVRACTTLRFEGESHGPWTSFNQAAHVGDDANAVHVGDDANAVLQNREHLQHQLNLPSAPLWLTQQHRTYIVDAAQVLPGIDADGSYTTTPGIVCAILSADCLPVFLCREDGSAVMLLHAGWRGLAAGIIEKGVQRLREQSPQTKLLAAFGPAIGPAAYEIGDEVRQQLQLGIPDEEQAFRPSGRESHWYLNLYALASAHLRHLDVDTAPAPQWCTHTDEHRFFSYRRTPTCGRMASLIWIAE